MSLIHHAIHNIYTYIYSYSLLIFLNWKSILLEYDQYVLSYLMILYTHFHLILCFILQVKQSEATTEKKNKKKKRVYTPEQKKRKLQLRRERIQNEKPEEREERLQRRREYEAAKRSKESQEPRKARFSKQKENDVAKDE